MNRTLQGCYFSFGNKYLAQAILKRFFFLWKLEQSNYIRTILKTGYCSIKTTMLALRSIFSTLSAVKEKKRR